MRLAHHADGLVELAVVEDDERRLAAELERAELRVAARAAARSAADAEAGMSASRLLAPTDYSCCKYMHE